MGTADPLPPPVLRQPVLQLNKHFQVLRVCTALRALKLLAKGAAEAVNHWADASDPAAYETYSWADWTALRSAHGDAVARTGVSRRDGETHEVVVPQVIRVLANVQPFRVVTCSRLNIAKRDGFKCQYCGKKTAGDDLTMDHVIPRAQGGTFTWGNIVVACIDCNQRKGGRNPRQAGMTLLRKPEKPEWRPHYADPKLRFTSWDKFISDVYWAVPLKQG